MWLLTASVKNAQEPLFGSSRLVASNSYSVEMQKRNAQKRNAQKRNAQKRNAQKRNAQKRNGQQHMAWSTGF
jgi:hypothetical protein